MSFPSLKDLGGLKKELHDRLAFVSKNGIKATVKTLEVGEFYEDEDSGQVRAPVTLEVQKEGGEKPYQTRVKVSLWTEHQKWIRAGRELSALIDPEYPDFMLIDWGNGKMEQVVYEV